MTKNTDRRNMSTSVNSSLLAGVILLSATLVNPSIVISESAFNHQGSVAINAVSDTMKSPTNLKVTNSRVGETDLSWTSSVSSYVTGYKILRSSNKYGPWAQIGTVNSRTTTTFTDKTSGSNSWFYRVESVYKNWSSTGEAYEAPPAVGASFYDSFSGAAGPLDGRQTEDGLSVWQVWKGDMNVSGTGWLDNSKTAGSSLAVVRTPTQNATMFMNDVDGAEQFILRGKDPQNYIIVGGAAPASGTWKGMFEIAEVRNGVKTVLMSGNTIDDNQDMRVEINGSTIKVWLQANKTNKSAGTLFANVSTSFLAGDNTATYFGFGFSRSDFSISDFTFEAL